ncbi:hypothetical protein BHE74_00029697 [Ensete ventricosum]|nr:hypothetical protein BHE74_00029697 [Ensete ventricosum]
MSQERPSGNSNAEPPSPSGRGHHVGANSKPLLEDDDRPGVPTTDVQPRAICRHDRGLSRSHQPSSSAGWHGVNYRTLPTTAYTVGNPTIGCSGDTPPDGVTYGPESGGSTQDRGTTMSGRISSCRFLGYYEVQKEVLKSKGKVEESLKGGSPFTPEIQDKPFRPISGSQPSNSMTIRERGLLKTPNPMKTRSERHDKRRYCRFHREYGNDTDECRDLQSPIEDLIQHGHLRRYVRDQSALPGSRPPRDPSPQSKGPVEKQIDVIMGGPALGGNSSSARKAYARTEVGKRHAHEEDLDITFKSGNEESMETSRPKKRRWSSTWMKCVG